VSVQPDEKEERALGIGQMAAPDEQFMDPLPR
jgi:hypothetical protein